MMSEDPRSEDFEATRGVALDLDGILLDGMQFHIAAWHQAFAHYDVKLDERELYLLEGIKTRDVVDRLAVKYHLDLSPDSRSTITKLKKDSYQAKFKPVPLEGAATLLDTCRECKYRIAIVTGTHAIAATQTLELLGRLEWVDHIISADLNIPGKPDPAPFREAAERLGLPPSHCLAVDNAPAGLESAVNAGLPCVGVATYLPASDLSKADQTFGSVTALATWIKAEYEISHGTGPWSL
jgi:HAD superfamily hydrolase (TIGR01509 family)